MSTKKSYQESMSTKDMHEYLTFFFSKEVKDDKHAKRLKLLAKRTVTLSDVVVIVKALTSHQDDAVVQLMDKLQIQERVIKKLQATDEMFLEAQEEYFAILKEREEAFKAQLEAMKSLEQPEAEEEAGEA